MKYVIAVWTAGRSASIGRKCAAWMTEIGPSICTMASGNGEARGNNAPNPAHPSEPTTPVCTLRPDASALVSAISPLWGNQSSVEGSDRLDKTLPRSGCTTRARDPRRAASSGGKLPISLLPFTPCEFDMANERTFAAPVRSKSGTRLGASVKNSVATPQKSPFSGLSSVTLGDGGGDQIVVISLRQYMDTRCYRS